MINRLFHNAGKSALRRWIANRILWNRIPFNSPHKIRIKACDERSLTLCLPFIRRNKNHINGMHACALATLCEYATGLQLARLLDAGQYRLILKEIKVKYTFQAKKDVYAYFAVSEIEINSILKELENNDSAMHIFNVELNDGENPICTGNIHWQIKKWSAVKTKK